MFRIFLIAIILSACSTSRNIHLPKRTSSLTGSEFYSMAAAMGWQQRDSFALKEILAGNVPSFLSKFTEVPLSAFDSSSNKLITATVFVSNDYLSIGTDQDWARVPLTPMSAQIIADTFNCFLPTRKLVDEIYKASKVKIPPMPMFAYRDSTVTMYQHHLIIEGQRKGRSGLISGIKKDVVISSRISQDARPNRVAIYGWHKTDGRAIQPLYTGHVNWYVDYSHGIRLVYRKILVNGKWMDYEEIMKDPVLSKLLCDEADCSYLRYR